METVIAGGTGVLFETPTVESLSAALDDVARATFDPARIRRHAEQFSRERHLQQMRALIDETVSAPAGSRW